MTTPAQAIREAMEGITEGPWHVVPYGDGDSLVLCMDEEGNRRIAFMATPGSRDHNERRKTWQRIKSDARFIATARNHLPTLLSDLEAKDKEIAELVSLLRRGKGFVEDVKRGGHWIGPSWGDETNLWREGIDAKLKELGHG